MMTVLRWTCVAAAMLAMSLPAQAADQRALTVMLTGRGADGQSDGSLCAAGIIIGQSDARTLILTANHVVETIEAANEDGAESRLHAEFWGRRGATFPVDVLDSAGLRSRSLDYAVLAVSSPGVPALEDESFAVLGGLSFEGGPDRVVSIGNPDCRPWDRDAEPKAVVSSTSLEIVFESSVTGGASGGPLFTADGALVGMVTNTDGRRGIARPFDLIRELLTAQNLAMDLKLPPEPEFVPVASAYDEPQPPIVTAIRPSDFALAVHSVNGREVTFNLSSPPAVSDQINRVEGFGGIYNDWQSWRFSLKQDEISRAPEKLTVIFDDESRLEVPVDTARLVREHLSEVSRQAPHWLDCTDGFYCRLWNSVQSLPLFTRLEIGFERDHPIYFVECSACRGPEAGSPMRDGLVDLTGLEAVLIPSGATELFYRLTLGDQVTPAMSHKLGEPRLRNRPPRPMLVRSSTPGGPPLYASADTALDTGVMAIQFPGRFATALQRADTDGRGYLPVTNLVPWPAGDEFAVELTDPDTTATFGPYRYRIDKLELLKTTAPFPAIDTLFECRRIEARRLCGVEDLSKLYLIKSVQIGHTAPDALRPMAIGAMGDDLLDDASRKRLSRCDLRSCAADYGRYGAVVEIPDDASDFYYQVELTNSQRSAVIRMPLPR